VVWCGLMSDIGVCYYCGNSGSDLSVVPDYIVPSNSICKLCRFARHFWHVCLSCFSSVPRENLDPILRFIAHSTANLVDACEQQGQQVHHLDVFKLSHPCDTEAHPPPPEFPVGPPPVVVEVPVAGAPGVRAVSLSPSPSREAPPVSEGVVSAGPPTPASSHGGGTQAPLVFERIPSEASQPPASETASSEPPRRRGYYVSVPKKVQPVEAVYAGAFGKSAGPSQPKVGPLPPVPKHSTLVSAIQAPPPRPPRSSSSVGASSVDSDRGIPPAREAVSSSSVPAETSSLSGGRALLVPAGRRREASRSQSSASRDRPHKKPKKNKGRKKFLRDEEYRAAKREGRAPNFGQFKGKGKQ
jgi:hypothetical protein